MTGDTPLLGRREKGHTHVLQLALRQASVRPWISSVCGEFHQLASLWSQRRMKATGTRSRQDSGCHWEGREASSIVVSCEKLITSTSTYLALRLFPEMRGSGEPTVALSLPHISLYTDGEEKHVGLAWLQSELGVKERPNALYFPVAWRWHLHCR